MVYYFATTQASAPKERFVSWKQFLLVRMIYIGAKYLIPNAYKQFENPYCIPMSSKVCIQMKYVSCIISLHGILGCCNCFSYFHVESFFGTITHFIFHNILLSAWELVKFELICKCNFMSRAYNVWIISDEISIIWNNFPFIDRSISEDKIIFIIIITLVNSVGNITHIVHWHLPAHFTWSCRIHTISRCWHFYNMETLPVTFCNFRSAITTCCGDEIGRPNGSEYRHTSIYQTWQHGIN